MFKNILIAFDGSEHSHEAAVFAAGISRAVPGVKCTVITVLTFTKDEARFLGITEQDYENNQKELEKKIFKNIRRYFEELGLHLETVVKQGSPDREIIKFARESGADHIIIGTRGLGNIQGALLGSVSSKVVHLAECPVTLVKEVKNAGQAR